MRLKLPPNYRITAHWHPAFEHITVLDKDGAVIQLHGMGPWQIYYVNSEDDPRQQANRPAPSR